MPLSGLKVVEFSSILAGPAVGMFLAELGAEVIKVENPAHGGDPTRGWCLAQEETPPGLSAYFCSVNWGKRSISLNLSEPEEQSVARKLCGEADVVLSNFKQGDEAKLGLAYEDLRKQNPRLIIATVSGYGQGDPRPGFDAMVQAESGFVLMNGPIGGPPCKVPVAVIDLLAAHQLKEAILLALLERERSGVGRIVGVSLWETALASLINQATNVLMADHDPQPCGTEHPNLFPYGTLLECRDGQIMVAVGTDTQFAKLCAALEFPELQQQFATNRDRTVAREQLRERLQSGSRKLTSLDLLERLRQNKVPSGKLASVREALSSKAGHELQLHQDRLKGIRSTAFTGFERRALQPPPQLNQHGAEILKGLNGD